MYPSICIQLIKYNYRKHTIVTITAIYTYIINKMCMYPYIIVVSIYYCNFK